MPRVRTRIILFNLFADVEIDLDLFAAHRKGIEIEELALFLMANEGVILAELA